MNETELILNSIKTRCQIYPAGDTDKKRVQNVRRKAFLKCPFRGLGKNYDKIKYFRKRDIRVGGVV
jgi:hypothetical protein